MIRYIRSDISCLSCSDILGNNNLTFVSLTKSIESKKVMLVRLQCKFYVKLTKNEKSTGQLIEECLRHISEDMKGFILLDFALLTK